jgi:hypothetical protein
MTAGAQDSAASVARSSGDIQPRGAATSAVRIAVRRRVSAGSRTLDTPRRAGVAEHSVSPPVFPAVGSAQAPPVTTSVWPLTKSLSGLQKR